MMRGAGRPAASAASVMCGTTCDAMVRSSASHRTVPAARSPASFSMTGPMAAIMTGVGVMSVTSSGWLIVNSSLSTSTRPGPASAWSRTSR